jgi:hypothetical protein
MVKYLEIFTLLAFLESIVDILSAFKFSIDVIKVCKHKRNYVKIIEINKLRLTCSSMMSSDIEAQLESPAPCFLVQFF